jgi:hypothetical protein
LGISKISTYLFGQEKTPPSIGESFPVPFYDETEEPGEMTMTTTLETRIFEPRPSMGS